MNFEFAALINPKLEKLNFDKALSIAETALKQIPETPFHSILGKTLTGESEFFAKWVNSFFNIASKEIDVEALYFEINEFNINPDSWVISIFAFSKDGGLDPDDMDWLCDYEIEHDTSYQIPGLEVVQEAFEKTELNSRALMDAYDWCEQIVIIRFMEFIRETHIKAAEKNYAWSKVPVYFTEHDYDFVGRSINN